MPKRFALCLIAFFTSAVIQAQAVLISGSPGQPDPSSSLEVRSTQGGLLPPRMTETQRNNIANPATGLMIYNTTSGCMETYLPTAGWRAMVCDCPLPPSNLLIASDTTIFAGTTINFSATVSSGFFQWTFPSGSPAGSSAQSPSAVFNTSGNFNVVLLVDSSGCTFSDTLTISVTSPARNCSTLLANSPGTLDGTYLIDPDGAGGVAPFNCYCDMTTDGGGWASIFTLSGNLSLSPRQCLFNNSNDDHDSYIMWIDLENKIANSNTYSTNANIFWTIDRNTNASVGTQSLSNQSSGLGVEARPIPFPGSQKVAWIDYQNNNLRFGSQTVSLSALNVTSTWFVNGANYYIITDGVDMALVGRQGVGARLLRFNWQNNTVTDAAAQLFNPVSWRDTEEDAFGHVLYTVNGRIMHYHQGGQFRLSGTLTNPNPVANTWSVTWNLGFDTQHGLDFFSHVDNNGELWFGDWGHDNGGFFNCGNDNQMGVAKTNIQLTY